MIDPKECVEIYKLIAEGMVADVKNQFESHANMLGIKDHSFSAKMDEDGNIHTTFRASWDIYIDPNP